MPRLLRVTEGPRWDFDLPSWRDKEDLPAAPFGDLRPSGTGKLSVWLIEDDEINLDRIIAGMAANRPNVDVFDGRLIDKAAIENLGLQLVWSSGASKDKDANKWWHYNIVDLTYVKLGKLVAAMASDGEPVRRSPEEVKNLILTSIRAGYIQLKDLKPPPPGEQSVWAVVSEILREEGWQVDS